jgi:hypothetical protein
VRNRSRAIASDPATILRLARALLVDKAARISDGAKGAEALDHPLTSLDRRAESLRSRLEVFGKKNSAKNLGAAAVLRSQSQTTFFAIFPKKKSGDGEYAEPLGRASLADGVALGHGLTL